MSILLIWIGLSLPMAFVVGRILRGSSVPAPSHAVPTGDAVSMPGQGIAGAAALAREAVEPGATRSGV